MSETVESSVLTRLRVKGFKSLKDATLTVRPLTILCGANSSGKSSMMQPLLLMKQTEEASYRTDGTLKLDGPLAYLNSASDVVPAGQQTAAFTVEATFSSGERIQMGYAEDARGGLGLTKVEHGDGKHSKIYRIGEVDPDFVVRKERLKLDVSHSGHIESEGAGLSVPVLAQNLEKLAEILRSKGISESRLARLSPLSFYLPAKWLQIEVEQMIYLPGLRGMPERAYPKTAPRGEFEGPFPPYTASVLEGWQRSDPGRAKDVQEAVKRLGLSRSVEAVAKGANEVEIRVGRLPAGSRGKDTLVNLADVGLGMSQVLPLVVALIAAEPGQIVYIEQPELHLHPKAQRALADVLADAARRGVRVIFETHSAILLLAAQTLVAEGTLAPDLVALHWFSRDSKGFTKVTLAELDEEGAFGPEWPEDFSDTELDAQSAYLNAVTMRKLSPQ